MSGGMDEWILKGISSRIPGKPMGAPSKTLTSHYANLPLMYLGEGRRQSNEEDDEEGGGEGGGEEDPPEDRDNKAEDNDEGEDDDKDISSVFSPPSPLRLHTEGADR